MVLLVLVLGEVQAGPRWSKEAQTGPRWSNEVQDGPANFRNGFAGNARALSSVSSVSFYVTEGLTNSKRL